MQSYEEAGGYGVGDYYGSQSGGDNGASGYGGGGEGGFAPKRGGFRGGSRGGMSRGGGGMRGGSFSGGSRGGARGGARGGGMSRGGGGGAMRGGRPMRGRGAGQRFNPMAGGGSGFGGAPAGHIVFAYNIGSQTGEEDVQQLFSLYGAVSKVDVIWDNEKNQGKGYAFITMPDYDEAANAIQQLNGYNYAGKPLQVSFKSAKQ